MKKILLTLIILASYGCGTTRIIDPSPTDVPASLTSEDVYSAIMLSLKDVPDVTGSGQNTGNNPYEWMAGEINPENLSWHHEGQDGNVIHAGFYYERFYISAKVTYTKDYINYSLVESRNLRQDPGLNHSKAYTWLARLEGDVRLSLEKIDRYKREQSKPVQEAGTETNQKLTAIPLEKPAPTPVRLSPFHPPPCPTGGGRKIPGPWHRTAVTMRHA